MGIEPMGMGIKQSSETVMLRDVCCLQESALWKYVIGELMNETPRELLAIKGSLPRFCPSFYGAARRWRVTCRRCTSQR
jgi:hypothetical protein